MKKLALIAIVATILAGCVRNNPDPAWLEVTEWTFESNAIGVVGDEGILTHNFTDAWVFIDNKFIGVFEVPFKIPVLVSGESEIKLYPTIRNNGISATKKIYPYADPYIISANLVQNQTLTVNPVTRYKDNTTIRLWDFDDPGNLQIEAGQNSNTTLIFDNDPMVMTSINGSGYGHVNFTNSMNQWQATSLELSDVPQQQAEVYLEIDYYNTVPIVTGVIAVEPSAVTGNVNVQINSQDEAEIEWKKIYLDLKTIVSGYPNAYAYRLSFDAILPDSLQTGYINIDNMKLVHR
ncbi:MAG: hypothetical protein DCO96_12345 [Fluviicola sp. XM-24bin1]|nr:MAG: hypothetical protein DCO96_12345 [Fluviicola sp. XM-24bin1]